MKNRRPITAFTLSLSLALLYLLVGIPTPLVHAANYTVTNISDSGPGSLRQAILEANSNPGHDTINFSVNRTIVLASALPAITDDLSITGLGAEQLAVSGNNAHRVFHINAGSAVTITGLIAQEGTAVNGGGILNEGTLHLDNMHVNSNTATGSWPNGRGWCRLGVRRNGQ